MLEVRDLRAGYGSILAVKGISLSIRQGQIVALIGANGAGKTTTLRSIVGLLRPSGGDIRFEGESLLGRSPADVVKRGIALVPEGRRIFGNLSVVENLRMGAFLHWDRRRLEHDVAAVLERLPALKGRERQKGATLSGGEQQMLAIARALMARPRLLLLDEPSMGLAPRLVEVVFDILQDIRSRDTTILLVEQNARLALALADEGYVMETGQIVLHDEAGRLRENDAVRRAYLGGPSRPRRQEP
jgi:branched-chain amino acid transport system ATP-binding protein